MFLHQWRSQEAVNVFGSSYTFHVHAGMLDLTEIFSVKYKCKGGLVLVKIL